MNIESERVRGVLAIIIACKGVHGGHMYGIKETEETFSYNMYEFVPFISPLA